MVYVIILEVWYDSGNVHQELATEVLGVATDLEVAEKFAVDHMGTLGLAYIRAELALVNGEQFESGDTVVEFITRDDKTIVIKKFDLLGASY